MLTFGSLFAGIGGIDLGLERTGMKCVWQVEINDYARRVLAKHWPHVRRWGDVRTFPPEPASAWGCDLVAGGFPCQDISNAGRRAGIDGERSGLWGEFARVVRLVRPRYVFVENVAALLVRGMGRVLGDLEACGYDAEWQSIPAAYLGAWHLRERAWIVAYSRNGGQSSRGQNVLREGGTEEDGGRETTRLETVPRVLGPSGRLVAHKRWTEPDVVRVVHGVSSRVDRMRCLGNAVVPQMAEWIGRRIVAADGVVSPPG